MTSPCDRGTVRSWSPEQKAEALAIYASEGLPAAVRETGIPKGTIGRWAYETGTETVSLSRTNAATAQHKATIAEHKSMLAAKMIEIAALGANLEIELLNAGEVSLRDVVGARTRAIHDMLLLTGEATARTETITDRTPVNEEELAEVVEMFTATEAA